MSNVVRNNMYIFLALASSSEIMSTIQLLIEWQKHYCNHVEKI